MNIHVIEVIPGPEHGNSMIFVKRQVDSLERNGAEVRRFFLSSRTSPIKLLSEFIRFRRAVSSFKPDVIHSQYGTVTALFCATSSLLPLVITFRGSDINHSSSNGLIRSVLQIIFSQLASLRAKQVICVSKGTKKKLWFAQHKAHVIPNGVNLSTFRLMSKEDARSRLRWNLKEKIVLFNAGRHPEVKRLNLARLGFEMAFKKCEALRLVVLNGLVDEKHIPVYMNAADCLLVTSAHEGAPNIVKEALACNLPLVSVDVGDIKERIQGVSPSKIVAEDPESIAEGLIWCLNQNRGSNGRAIIEKELDEGQVAKQIIAILTSAKGDRHAAMNVVK